MKKIDTYLIIGIIIFGCTACFIGGVAEGKQRFRLEAFRAGVAYKDLSGNFTWIQRGVHGDYKNTKGCPICGR